MCIHAPPLVGIIIYLVSNVKTANNDEVKYKNTSVLNFLENIGLKFCHFSRYFR